MRGLLDSLLGVERRDESVIDFPQDDLDPQIWVKEGETYHLRDDVRDIIYSSLDKFDPALRQGAEEIHITGSIGTNQYGPETDIDVHIIPSSDLLAGKDGISYQKEVFKWFGGHRDDIGAYVEAHPLEVYVQLNPAQEMLSDAVYNIPTDDWLKGPTIVPTGFDPYEEFSHLLDDVRAEAGNADEILGELKRDVIDYSIIKQAVGRMMPEDKKRLLGRLQSKLEEIEKDVRDLCSKKQGWIDARKGASQPSTPEEALRDVEMVRKWRNRNALFKFLDRYHYMRLIKDLEQLIKDDELDQDEVKVIQGLLGV